MSVLRFHMCLSWILALAPIAALSACAPVVTGGAAEASQAEEGADPEDGDGDGDKPHPDDGSTGCGGETAATCEALTIGTPETCMSPIDMKDAAVALCDQIGLIAVDVSPAWDCPDGGATYAKILCCDSGAPAGTPEVPPDPGPSPAGSFGDGVTCVADADFLAMADAACAEIDMVLVDLYLSGDCPDGASLYAKYVCGAP